MPFNINVKHRTEKVEYIFVMATDGIGVGTQGLGEDVSQSATSTLQREYMKDYWENRGRLVAQRKAEEQDRLKKIERDQLLSPRARMLTAMDNHQKEIEKMIEERKKFEKEWEAKVAAAATEKNQLIHEQKEYIQQQHEEAKSAREAKVLREAELARKKRAELLAMDQEETEMYRKIQHEHIVKLRHYHEVCKNRAKEAAEQRFKEKQETVAALRNAQKEKEKGKGDTSQDVVLLKAEKIKKFNAHDQVCRRVLYTRVDDNIRAASQQKQEIRARQTERKEKEKKYIEHQKEMADTIKKESAELRQRYYEEKRKQQKLALENAAKQKAQALAQIAAEHEESRLAHHEYIQLAKEIATRGARPSPQAGAVRSKTAPI